VLGAGQKIGRVSLACHAFNSALQVDCLLHRLQAATTQCTTLPLRLRWQVEVAVVTQTVSVLHDTRTSAAALAAALNAAALDASLQVTHLCQDATKLLQMAPRRRMSEPNMYT
jgi:hypothetical protein